MDKAQLLVKRLLECRTQWGDKRMALNNDMQNAFASALLDQLEDLGTDVK